MKVEWMENEWKQEAPLIKLTLLMKQDEKVNRFRHVICQSTSSYLISTKKPNQTTKKFCWMNGTVLVYTKSSIKETNIGYSLGNSVKMACQQQRNMETETLLFGFSLRFVVGMSKWAMLFKSTDGNMRSIKTL